MVDMAATKSSERSIYHDAPLDNMGAAARSYSERGWAWIDLPHGAKAPTTKNWTELRYTIGDIPQRFNGRPKNIGVLLGEASSGLVDIDKDCSEAVLLAPYFLDNTACSFGRPGSPKSHDLYIAEPLANTKRYQDPTLPKEDTRATLVEYRSTGAQTVFPPSVHPSGDVYTWEEFGEPTTIDGRVLFAQVSELAAACLLARHWPGPGSRQDSSLALAGGLLRGGWTQERVNNFIEAVVTAAGDDEGKQRLIAGEYTQKRLADGKSATGWRRLSELIDSRVINQARDWLTLKIDNENQSAEWEKPVPFHHANLPTFPTDALPTHLRDYVEELATATQTPPDLAATLVLGALGAACQGKAEIHIRGTWKEQINLYIATVLGSGTRKTTVVQQVTAPLETFEREQATKMAPEVAKAEAETKTMKARLDRLQNEAARAKSGDEKALAADIAELAAELATRKTPSTPRLLADDVTPEKLASLMAANNGRMAVFSAEGDIFDLMAGRYGNAPNFGVFLKAHVGEPLRVDRVGRAPEHIATPRLTLGLAVQPDVMRGLCATPQLRGRGLLGRFLYSWPASTVGRRLIEPPPMRDHVRQNYNSLMANLLELIPEHDPDGNERPHVLRMGEDAYNHFVVFQSWLEPQLAEDANLGSMTDWAGKLAGHVARIAALLHLASRAFEDDAYGQSIDTVTISNAIRIGRYLLAHAIATFGEMGADPDIEDARRVLGWIERTGKTAFTQTDAYRDLRGHFKRPERLLPALKVLAEHGYIREQDQGERAGRGRKPAPAFDVNPLSGE